MYLLKRQDAKVGNNCLLRGWNIELCHRTALSAWRSGGPRGYWVRRPRKTRWLGCGVPSWPWLVGTDRPLCPTTTHTPPSAVSQPLHSLPVSLAWEPYAYGEAPADDEGPEVKRRARSCKGDRSSALPSPDIVLCLGGSLSLPLLSP